MIYSITKNISEMPYQVRMPFGIKLASRTLRVCLEKYDLIISPGYLDESTWDKLKRESREPLLVAPNLFHHLYLEKAKKQLPHAKIYAPENIERKQAWLKDGYTPIQELARIAPKELLTIPLDGHDMLAESVFYHLPSKTLIVTDLLFNLKNEMNFQEKIVFKTFGTYQRLSMSRLLKISCDNKDKFRLSLKKITELDCERIIPAHGAIIERVDEAFDILRSF